MATAAEPNMTSASSTAAKPVKRPIPTRNLVARLISITARDGELSDLKKLRAHSHIPEMRSTLKPLSDHSRLLSIPWWPRIDQCEGSRQTAYHPEK